MKFVEFLNTPAGIIAVCFAGVSLFTTVNLGGCITVKSRYFTVDTCRAETLSNPQTLADRETQ